MRVSRLVACLLSSGAIACGGGSSKPILVDAAPPDAFACVQRGTLTATTPLDFSKTGGQAQGTVPMGRTELTVSALVTFASAPTTGFIIIQVNNAGVFGAAGGAAGRFEKPPTPGSYPMDTDMNLGFGIDFVDGVGHTASGGATVNSTQVALLDPTAGGTVKIDSWTPAAAPDGTTTIAATFTNAKFKGFNVLANGSLDPAGNGCDITVPNLQFTGLSVKWQTAPFPVSFAPPLPPRPDFGTRTLDGAAALSAELTLDP